MMEMGVGSAPRVRAWKLTAIFYCVALVLVFGAFSVGRWINLDENVFIASAALVSRHWVLYRDFHYNHMPTLVLLYAALFRVTNYLVLAARSVSALCAAGAAAIFFHAAYKNLPHLGRSRQLWFSVGIGFFFLGHPLFTTTAGRSWNHDFPVLMSLLGYLLMARGLGEGKVWAVILSGVMVGLAFTARLTFATEMLPFVVFVGIYPNLSLGRRVALVGAFFGGVVIAAAPSLYVWAQAPVNAYFDNFQYPRLNTQWHRLHDDAEHFRYSLGPKLWYFFKITWELPGNGILFYAFVILIGVTLRWRRIWADDIHCRLFVLVLLAGSQLAAGFVPSPPFLQYFYAATPFMLMAVILCLGRLRGLVHDQRINWICIICIGICVGRAAPEYRGLPRLFWPPAWWPIKLHRLSEQVAGLAGPGRMLTMDPIFPLEGGMEIYPPLATGCFGLRVGDYLPEDKRAEYRMWGTEDIDRQFAEDPPGSILISGDDNDVKILTIFRQEAADHGYHQIVVNKQAPLIILWVKNAAS